MNNEIKFYLIKKHGKDSINEIVGLNKRPTDKRNHGIFSCSIGYNSKKELLKDCKVLNEPCIICGGLVKSTWLSPYDKLTIEKKTCFSCLNWEENILLYNKGQKTVIDGEMYVVKLDNPDAYFKGCGGREYKIKYKDSGNEIISHNVWCNGSIPTRFKSQLPDNATFI